MKNNRRKFLKHVGLGSGLLVTNPGFAFTSGEVDLQDIKRNADVFAKRLLKTDILIAGGGMSGVCAALAAARNGAKVILIQNRSRLGGNASSEIRMHISGASTLQQVWRETGILEELVLTEAVTNPQVCYEMFDYVLYDKVHSEKNITLLLDTMLFDVESQDDQIQLIRAYCSQTEELYEISASYFADCTGDATLAALAGAEFMRGREAKSQWNESLGQDQADEVNMGSSLMFQARKHDRPMPFVAPSWARKYTFKDFMHRRIDAYDYGYWWLELGGKVDIVKDILNDGQRLRDELMAVMFGVWDYIKNSGDHPDSANWSLSWFGMIPGKRESRRIVGDYIMIQRDIQSPQPFEDRVAYGGWPLDDHLPDGMDDTSKKPNTAIRLKGPYSIPLRSLHSKSFSNLFMAGRNVSVSHVALSSTRVMATCATMGQAIGTAMAYCISAGIGPASLSGDKSHMQRLQQQLLRQDQAILDVVNTDEKDLARKASVRASAETAEGKAAYIIDGYNRLVADGKTHHWQAEMTGEPWIELHWDTEQTLGTIECTFDTGLHRYLRISPSQAVLDMNQVRGPQPETVSGYTITVQRDGQTVHEEYIDGNYLRKRVHTFSPVTCDTVRISVRQTHGDQLARIFEIRCYS